MTEEGVPKQERTLAMFCHLGAFAGYIFPFGNILAPLIIWLIKKEEMPFVNDQGKESLNFQISITIYFLISILLALVLIGYVLMLGLAIFDVVMVIIATVKANKGEAYRYPLTIRFLK
ncbi:MAG TPA: DUF4870 domain-containing protein [Nitrospirae bacterium]|nr:hypothetical protein BMS3Bbin08_01981 [bacterium BMS3Bbin08]HDH01003.1 DUF4870 domain-containing protein [Nitrospirota bacterium]HDK82600.1 DUF4870 domain-containing protein [Nitrospirota bacterium]